MDSPDKYYPFNISIPNDPFKFTMPVTNQMCFAKADIMVDQ